MADPDIGDPSKEVIHPIAPKADRTGQPDLQPVPSTELQNELDAREALRESYTKELQALAAKGKISSHEVFYRLQRFENDPDFAESVSRSREDPARHQDAPAGAERAERGPQSSQPHMGPERSDMVSQQRFALDRVRQNQSPTQAQSAPEGKELGGRTLKFFEDREPHGRDYGALKREHSENIDKPTGDGKDKGNGPRTLKFPEDRDPERAPGRGR